MQHLERSKFKSLVKALQVTQLSDVIVLAGKSTLSLVPPRGSGDSRKVRSFPKLLKVTALYDAR
ncbi:hypothetical protein BgiMline_025838, partial [Biomphalaria glabrata]